MALKNFDYYRPRTAAEAGKLLATVAGTRAKSGGTDLLPLLKERLTEASGVVNLMTAAELAGIGEEKGRVRIGATTTLAQIAESGLVRQVAPAVARAAETAATPNLRNLATLGGNLAQRPRCWYYRSVHHECIKKGGSVCFSQDGENKYNAIFGNQVSAVVHPSNLAPALLAHEATVHVQGQEKSRDVPIAEFFVSPEDNPVSETVLEAGEIIAAVSLAPLPAGAGSAYVEVREKQSFDWALVNAAARVDLEGGKVKDAHVVVSAVAPVPLRRGAAETTIKGKRLDEASAWAAGEAAVAGATPLRDNRYKIRMLTACVAEALLEAGRNAEARR